MIYNTELKLDSSWTVESEIIQDEMGEDITQISAGHSVDKEMHEDCHVEISVGPLPEEITAEDEAFANYVELVGFTDDEQDNPINKEKFNNKPAYVFEADLEDGSIMRVICTEARKGCLALITLYAIDDEMLNYAHRATEKGLRISAAE